MVVGATSATFLIQTTAVAANTSAQISATYGGVKQTATLTAQPIELVSVSVSPASVEGGDDSELTVTLNGPAPRGGVVITLSSSNSRAASVPASVSIPAGVTSVTVPVSTGLTSTTETVTLTGAYGGAKQGAPLTLTP